MYSFQPFDTLQIEKQIALQIYQRIREACRKSDMELVARIMHEAKKFGYESMPLYVAAMTAEDIDVVIGLLKSGCDPNQINHTNKDFPLNAAVFHHNIIGVHTLLKAGANPKQVNSMTGLFPLIQSLSGVTYIHPRVCKCPPEIIELLLKYGADPNQIDPKSGNFPLLTALEFGSETNLKRLLDAGANPRQVNEKTGDFPLLKASQRGDYNSVHVKHLLEAGANPNQVNETTGDFPLLMAQRNRGSNAPEIIQDLINAGANPNQVNQKTGGFPLLESALCSNLSGIELLLDSGANPNQVNTNTGDFPLYACIVFLPDLECTRILLEKGANPNQKHSKTGKNFLVYTIERNYQNIVRLLLEHGADVEVSSSKKRLYIMSEASAGPGSDIVKSLLAYGADPNRVDPKTGDFPLYLACSQRRTKNVGVFLDHDKLCRVKMMLLCCAREYLTSKTDTVDCLFDSDYFPYDLFRMVLGFVTAVNFNQVHAKTQKTSLDIAKEIGQIKIVKMLESQK